MAVQLVLPARLLGLLVGWRRNLPGRLVQGVPRGCLRPRWPLDRRPGDAPPPHQWACRLGDVDGQPAGLGVGKGIGEHSYYSNTNSRSPIWWEIQVMTLCKSEGVHSTKHRTAPIKII